MPLTSEPIVTRPAELVATIGAGAVGAVIAVSAVGASLVFALPGVAVVALVAVAASRRRAG